MGSLKGYLGGAGKNLRILDTASTAQDKGESQEPRVLQDPYAASWATIITQLQGQ